MEISEIDAIFLRHAYDAAANADCLRRKVGAALVRDGFLLSQTCNTTPDHVPSCSSGGCPRAQSGVPPYASYRHGAGVCIARHAEDNAIREAKLEVGRNLGGSTLYVTDAPCDDCWKLIVSEGIVRVIYMPEPSFKIEWFMNGAGEWTLAVHRISNPDLSRDIFRSEPT